MLHEITRDPAMLLWLSGTKNTKWSPNENYARELMELFTLGAGRGYSEQDVREQARALTGFDNEWRRGLGAHNVHFERKRHDAGTKRIFGKSGSFDWQDAVRLCLRHPNHPSFSSRSSGAILSPPRLTGQRAARSSSSTVPISRSARLSRRSSATPRSTPGRAW